jgi:hypothetical protein
MYGETDNIYRRKGREKNRFLWLTTKSIYPLPHIHLVFSYNRVLY